MNTSEASGDELWDNLARPGLAVERWFFRAPRNPSWTHLKPPEDELRDKFTSPGLLFKRHFFSASSNSLWKHLKPPEDELSDTLASPGLVLEHWISQCHKQPFMNTWDASGRWVEWQIWFRLISKSRLCFRAPDCSVPQATLYGHIWSSRRMDW